MDEADIVADRIGVLVRGRMRCVGTSLELKQRYGAGYRVSLVGEKGGAARVKHLVQQRLAGAQKDK